MFKEMSKGNLYKVPREEKTRPSERLFPDFGFGAKDFHLKQFPGREEAAPPRPRPSGGFTPSWFFSSLARE